MLTTPVAILIMVLAGLACLGIGIAAFTIRLHYDYPEWYHVDD